MAKIGVTGVGEEKRDERETEKHRNRKKVRERQERRAGEGLRQTRD